MSLEVIIKPSGLLKKTPPFHQLLLDGIHYGSYDENYCFYESVMSDHLLLYHETCPNRGFQLWYNHHQLTLNLNFPTGDQEIKAFYRYIRDICTLMKVQTFRLNGQRKELSEIEMFIADAYAASQASLSQMGQLLSDDDYECIYIFGVFYPLAIDQQAFRIFQSDLHLFGSYLKDHMNPEARYLCAQYDTRPHQTIGTFALEENQLAIIPFNPAFSFSDERADCYDIYIRRHDHSSCTVPYDEFLKACEHGKRFDAQHLIIRVSSDLIENMRKYY